MAYFKDTLRGISWMAMLRFVVRGLAVIKIAILARILTPSQFGSYGIALLVLGLLEVLTETGINIFLIQEDDDTKLYLNSAWVVSIARGILISVVILLSAPLVSLFFKNISVTPLLYLVAAVSFVRGFINPMEVEFQKKLQFNKEFLFQAFLFLVDAVVSVALGFIMKSELAILLGMLSAALVEVIFSFIIFRDKPKFSIEWPKVKKVINSGKWVTGAGVFSYIFQNIDNLVVGRVLGVTQLGFYQQAYRISTLPVSEVGQIFNKVTFPVFVKISSEKERMKSAYKKTLLIIFSLVVPFGIFLMIFSRQIILIFLGSAWLPAEGALKVLALLGIYKSVLNSSYSLFLSLKLQKVVMYSELAGIVGISLLILPLTNKFGIYGASLAAFLGSILSLPVILLNFPKVFPRHN